ncbi:MAG TPA: AAA family ATPase [Solirubrobacteraceae bacterium]|nr:AAA family ATPase [Solirubrobacteraceae bacterium]HUB74935.1 AAA family ATPase [Solirubrobacteraceae bacterium]
MLRIGLFGGMTVDCDGEQLAAPGARRAWSLLAFLALFPGAHPRSEIAARFWPDVLDSSARASLRSAVWSLRRILGAHADRLQVDRNSVGLDRAELWVDAVAFRELLDNGRAREAVELCSGELLAGFEEEWALVARDEHREQLLGALEHVAARAEAEGDIEGALEYSRRAVVVDPLSEDAHRALIARLAAAGDLARALVVYRALAERLRRELSVAPSPATRELVHKLRLEGAEPAGEELAAVTSAARASPQATQPSEDGTATRERRPRSGGVHDRGPLVGRERELQRLLEVWERARAGSGAVACVRGEAGIGKTRLSSELLALAAEQGAAVAACAPLDLGGAAPFGLWAELLRKLLPAIPSPPAEAAWPEDLARLVPELPAMLRRAGRERPFVSPDLERTRLLEATVAAVEWAAGCRPLALLFEDTHLADASSLELTGYVARRIDTLPVLFVLTRRLLPRSAESERLEHALRQRSLLRAELTLAPLEREAVAELALAVAALARADVQRVVDAAEGNALLAVETARALARGERELAQGVRSAVQGAFGTLAQDGRRFVELAAVAAREVEPDEIAALRVADPAEAAAQALDSGMLVERERRIGFRHSLLRDAAYAEIALPRRASLHEQWARTLLGRPSPGGPGRAAEIARHLRLAGRDAEAVEQLALAAAGARAIGALTEAADYLEECLSIAGQDGAGVDPDLWLELGEVRAWRGLRTEAEKAFARAQELLESRPLELARAWLRSARSYHGPICAPAMVRQCCREALALLDRADAPAALERREALAALAWAEAVAGSVEEAERLLVQVHGLSSQVKPDDLSIYDIAHARALAMMRKGDFVAVYAPSIAAGEAITRAGRPDLAYGCWANAAGAAAAAGDYERALAFIDRCAQALAGKGLLVLELQLLAMRSFLLLRIGHTAEARETADQERWLAGRLGAAELEGMADHDRALVALAEREPALAGELFQQALDGEAPISRPLTRLLRAEALAHAGCLAEAEAEVRATALEPVRPSDFPATLVARMARVQGLIALLTGDRPLAERRLRESADGWGRLVSTFSRSDSLTVALADLGRPVVGLIEPEREHERVLAELQAIQKTTKEGVEHAVVS